MDLVNHFHQISKNTSRIRFNRRVLKNLGALPLPKKLEPCDSLSIQGIYLVSSGMLVEHTPSYILASSILGDERSSILFVGYCDPSTPGGKLLESNYDDKFEFEAYNHSEQIKAHIQQFDLSVMQIVSN